MWEEFLRDISFFIYNRGNQVSAESRCLPVKLLELSVVLAIRGIFHPLKGSKVRWACTGLFAEIMAVSALVF